MACCHFWFISLPTDVNSVCSGKLPAREQSMLADVAAAAAVNSIVLNVVLVTFTSMIS